MEKTVIPAEYSKELNESISVNQIAYGKNDSKISVMKDGISGECFLCDTDSDKVVFSAKASEKKLDATNGIYVTHFDFSEYTETGKYYIATEKGISYPFEISEKPYEKVTDAMIKALFYQRCGMDLEEKYAGEYSHKACHNYPAFDVTEPSRVFEDVSGGWHDAGDYGKYITPANQTVFNMMYIYELFENGCSKDLNIPESGNGIPDILNEAKYELDWMLKMQEEDGGVHHKVCSSEFAGNVLPADDKIENDFNIENPRLQDYLKEHPEIDLEFLKSHLTMSQVTLTATGGFSASMAIASRVYKKFYPEWSEKCLNAAKKAFDYAYNHIDEHENFKAVYPAGGGDYGDLCCVDEIYWGAAELFRTTGDKQYEDKFKELYGRKFSKTAFGAYNQGGHGSFAYCLSENADPEFKAKVLKDIIDGAEAALAVYNRNAYLNCLNDGVNASENEYYWGSNAALTNKLGNMISAGYLLKTGKYDQAIRDSVSYLFGRNYNSVCYVTGFGTKTIKNPHHRPSIFDGIEAPIPGFIAGGPNDRKWQRPSTIKGVRQSEGIDWDNMPPAGCYIDWEWNWTTNEITIYWNSSCFYVTAYLNSK